MKMRWARSPHGFVIAMVGLQVGVASLIGAASVTCTGWGVDANSRLLLGVRLGGYMGSAWLALWAAVKRQHLASALCLVVTGLGYVWLETGWLFTQPAFGPPSTFAMLPFLGALTVPLAPYLPTWGVAPDHTAI